MNFFQPLDDPDPRLLGGSHQLGGYRDPGQPEGWMDRSRKPWFDPEQENRFESAQAQQLLERAREMKQKPFWNPYSRDNERAGWHFNWLELKIPHILCNLYNCPTSNLGVSIDLSSFQNSSPFYKHLPFRETRTATSSAASPRGEQEGIQLGHGHLRGREGGRGARPIRRARRPRLQLHDELQDALHPRQAEGVHGGTPGGAGRAAARGRAAAGHAGTGSVL